MPPKNPPVGADLPDPHEKPLETHEEDPLRQLFRRHANHFTGVRARQIQTRLRHRLFTELPGDPDPLA